MKNEAFMTQAEEMMAPARKISELALDKTEKLVNLQVRRSTTMPSWVSPTGVRRLPSRTRTQPRIS